MKLYLSSFLKPSLFLFPALAFFFSGSESKAQCPTLMWSPVTELPKAPVHFNSDPIGCLDHDNKIELFLIGVDGAVWRTSQKEVNSSEWTSWTSLGHPPGAPLLHPDSLFPSFALCQDSRGLIHFFIAGKGVWEITQSTELSKWSGWHSLGNPQGDAKAIWAGTGYADGIELFVRTANNFLFHKWQPAGQSWTSNYSAVEWPKTGNPGKVLLAKDQRRHMQVFTSIGGAIFVKEQEEKVGVFGKWNLIKNPNSLILFDPFTISVANNADGRLELVTQSQVNRIWHAWQTPSPKDNVPEWANNWGRYNASLSDTMHIKTLEVLTGSNGCLTVFAQYPPDTAGKTQIRYLNQDRPSGEWRGWRYFEDKEFGMLSKGQMSLVTGHFGEFHVFVRGPGNSILTASSSR